MTMDRRLFLNGSAATVALMIVPIPFANAATHPDLEAAIDEILEGRSAVEGEIELEVPRVAENGAQVPLTIRVESPMTDDDHVTAIHVLATQNPAPGIGHFHLTPRVARAEVFTRIRVAEDQEILVFAEHSDGRVIRAAAQIAVSIGGCAT
ncbi:MAG: thiosulfate oxidation carrier protein SoxY [Roseinatronobacter sp.]